MCKWYSPRQFLSNVIESGFLSVPGNGGQQINAAFEDVLLSSHHETFSAIVQTSIDELEETIDAIIDYSIPEIILDLSLIHI